MHLATELCLRTIAIEIFGSHISDRIAASIATLKCVEAICSHACMQIQ